MTRKMFLIKNIKEDSYLKTTSGRRNNNTIWSNNDRQIKAYTSLGLTRLAITSLVEHRNIDVRDIVVEEYESVLKTVHLK